MPSSYHPTLRSHSQFPHCYPCPWVIHTCSLTSPFPLFLQLSPPPPSYFQNKYLKYAFCNPHFTDEKLNLREMYLALHNSNTAPKFLGFYFSHKTRGQEAYSSGIHALLEAVLKDLASFYLSSPLFSAFNFGFIVVKRCSSLRCETNIIDRKM